MENQPNVLFHQPLGVLKILSYSQNNWIPLVWWNPNESVIIGTKYLFKRKEHQ